MSDLHEGILRDLRLVLRMGLPLQPSSAGPTILSLRGVAARASDKLDPASLVAALDGVLRLKLAELPDPELKEAALRLFGVAKESANQTLTERRSQASIACGYEAHHFRKRVEPRLLATLSATLIADSENYSRNRAVAPSLMLQTRRPGLLPEDVLAWEAVEHEEALLRIWAAVYSLRAELLLIERLVSMAASAAELRLRADKALWQTAVLLEMGIEYQNAYGEKLVQSDWEFSAQDLLGLAGWIPPLSGPEKRYLAQSVRSREERGFVAELQSKREGRELVSRWRNELASRPQVKTLSPRDEQSETTGHK